MSDVDAKAVSDLARHVMQVAEAVKGLAERQSEAMETARAQVDHTAKLQQALGSVIEVLSDLSRRVRELEQKVG